MAADLKSNTILQRISLLLEPDGLVKLEHETMKDRVRKIMFDRVEQVLVWRQFPWLRIALVGIFLGLPGLLLAIVGLFDRVALGFAVILLGIAGVLLWKYFYCGKTTIRIIRAGRPEDITGVFRPGKLRPFLERLISGIQTTQAAGFQRIAQAQAAAEQVPPPTAQ